MRQRVNMARGICVETEILLMDEPFAALDEITRLKLNNDLLRLKQELGATVVFVTHSVFESVYLSSRIAVFSARPGRVVAEIEVDAPLPRDDDFRLTPLYAQACKEASDALHKAMGEA
jgi:NitT/TauT family transport system ATP-binding protein